jgi:hypothetical protein
MKKIKEDTFELRTGKIIHPDCGPAGIGKRWVTGFTLCEMEDNAFAYGLIRGNDDEPDLTKEEAIEVVDYMIMSWTMFAISLKK